MNPETTDSTDRRDRSERAERTARNREHLGDMRPLIRCCSAAVDVHYDGQQESRIGEKTSIFYRRSLIVESALLRKQHQKKETPPIIMP